jgi:hypothetical protein
MFTAIAAPIGPDLLITSRLTSSSRFSPIGWPTLQVKSSSAAHFSKRQLELDIVAF